MAPQFYPPNFASERCRSVNGGKQMCLLARAARQGTIGAPDAVDFAEAYVLRRARHVDDVTGPGGS